MSERLIQELVRRITDLERRERERAGKSPLFDVANENTPATFGASQDNYDPGDYDVLRLSASLAVNLTGISGGKKGRTLYLVNVGSFNITLQSESASSDAANRIKITVAAVTLVPNMGCSLYYDSTSQRWRYV